MFKTSSDETAMKQAPSWVGIEIFFGDMILQRLRAGALCPGPGVLPQHCQQSKRKRENFPFSYPRAGDEGLDGVADPHVGLVSERSVDERSPPLSQDAVRRLAHT